MEGFFPTWFWLPVDLFSLESALVSPPAECIGDSFSRSLVIVRSVVTAIAGFCVRREPCFGYAPDVGPGEIALFPSRDCADRRPASPLEPKPSLSGFIMSC